MLSQLPPELLVRIADILSPDTGYRPPNDADDVATSFVHGRNTLGPLSLTCRYLHTVLQALLFSHIYLYADRDFISSPAVAHRIQSLLERYSALCGLVRHAYLIFSSIPASSTASEDTAYTDIPSFICHLLAALPLLKTLRLRANAHVALNKHVLHAVQSHVGLQRMLIDHISSMFDRQFRLQRLPEARSKNNDKVMILYYQFSGSKENVEAKNLRYLLSIGISVEHLSLSLDSSTFESYWQAGILTSPNPSEQVSIPWSQLTFPNLERLTAFQSFPVVDGSHPGSFRSFVSRHPKLRHIQLSEVSSHTDIAGTFPVVSSIVSVCHQLGWEAREFTLYRSDSTSPFEEIGIFLYLIEDGRLEHLAAVNEACPRLQSMLIYPQQNEPDEFMAESEFVDFALSTIRTLFQAEMFVHLTNLRVIWQVDEQEYGDFTLETLEQSLEETMAGLALEIAISLRSVRLIEHKVKFFHEYDTMSFAFDVIRPQTSKGGIRLILREEDDNSDTEAQ